MRNPLQRTAVTIRERHRAKETVSELGRDYHLPEAVIRGIVEAKTAVGAGRVLTRYFEQQRKEERHVLHT